jgi:hypothetical protein
MEMWPIAARVSWLASLERLGFNEESEPQRSRAAQHQPVILTGVLHSVPELFTREG